MVRRSIDVDLDDQDSKLLKILEEFGWVVTKVLGSDSEPAFAYSVGLYQNFGHPEIILFGPDLTALHRIINTAGKRIQQGQKYEIGIEYDNLAEGCHCQFRIVEMRHYRELLGYGLWYYKGAQFPVVQLICPDGSGLFPWDRGFDETFRTRQPVLY